MIFDDQFLDFNFIRKKLAELPIILEPYKEYINAVLLFGSLAVEKETPLSDVDLAILYRRSLKGSELDQLHSQVWGITTDLLQSEDIDFINLNSAPLSMQYGAIKHAKILVLNSREAYIDFWEQSVKYYLDFKPLLDECNEELLNTLTGRAING